MNRSARYLRGLAALVFLLAHPSAAQTPSATVEATAAPLLCSSEAPDEEGFWVNADPDTRGITQINLDHQCVDVVLNGERPPSWYAHLWGSCSPTDCDWGEVEARWYRDDDGDWWVYAHYDQGFAKRYVYARMSEYRTGQLYLYIWTDFTDPNRSDYAGLYYFTKAGPPNPNRF